MKIIKEKHPLVMRWTHWVNFPILAIMVWSGLLIYWANDVFTITIFGHTFVRFFPEWLYKLLHIPRRLAEGMAFHFLFMWFFALNGFFYVLYTILSGQWRELLPNRHSFKEAWLVVLHDLHIRRTAPPQNKYNAAQRIAYTAIIIMGFGSLVTGLAIYKPVQFYWLVWLCGGYSFARIIHFVLTIGYVLFFVIHIVQVILAGWNNFRSVVSGFEVKEGPPIGPAAVDQKIRRRNFISFTTFFVAGGAAYKGWKALYDSPQETAGITAGAHKPLRRALNQTELAFRRLFSDDHMVRTYPKTRAAKNVRVNSRIGINDPAFKAEEWMLKVTGVPAASGFSAPSASSDSAASVPSGSSAASVPSGSSAAPTPFLKISIDQLKALPKTEIVYDFKCVEGWDQIQHWAGIRFSDFIAHFQLEEAAKKQYVGMETPDGAYYVGLDRASALHPQTLLAYEMNDRPLSNDHGAPLRLIIPVKYGIKNLKRIGTITFSDTRPRDYWAEQGYDYYSGL